MQKIAIRPKGEKSWLLVDTMEQVHEEITVELGELYEIKVQNYTEEQLASFGEFQGW